MLPEYEDPNDPNKGDIDLGGERDEFFEEAAKIIVQHQQGSTSLIQRRMKLGYNRAGRIMDQLEAPPEQEDIEKEKEHTTTVNTITTAAAVRV